MSLFEILQQALSEDPSFIEMKAVARSSINPLKRMLSVGEKVKTLKALSAGPLTLKKGEVGRILGKNQNPASYVVAFSSSVVHIDPALVAKANSPKDRTDVLFTSPVTSGVVCGRSYNLKSSWGPVLSSLKAGSRVKLVSNSAGNLGVFPGMVIVQSDSGVLFMVPSTSLDSVKDSELFDFDNSSDDYLSLGDHIGTPEVLQTPTFEVSAPNDVALASPTKESSKTRDVEQMKIGLIHKLEELMCPDTFKVWLDQNRQNLSAEAYRFGMELASLWGYRLGSVFSYPVEKNYRCRASMKAPYIYLSKLCISCVSRKASQCLRHGKPLLNHRVIASMTDQAALDLLSKGPIKYSTIYSSMKEFLLNEKLDKPKSRKTAGIRLEMEALNL